MGFVSRLELSYKIQLNVDLNRVGVLESQRHTLTKVFTDFSPGSRRHLKFLFLV